MMKVEKLNAKERFALLNALAWEANTKEKRQFGQKVAWKNLLKKLEGKDLAVVE